MTTREGQFSEKRDHRLIGDVLGFLRGCVGFRLWRFLRSFLRSCMNSPPEKTCTKHSSIAVV